RAGGEMLAGAAQHDGAKGGIGAEARELLVQCGEQGLIEAVALLGTVDDERRDATAVDCGQQWTLKRGRLVQGAGAAVAKVRAEDGRVGPGWAPYCAASAMARL